MQVKQSLRRKGKSDTSVVSKKSEHQPQKSCKKESFSNKKKTTNCESVTKVDGASTVSAMINTKKRKAKDEPKIYQTSKKLKVEKVNEKRSPEKKKSEVKLIVPSNNVTSAEKNEFSSHLKRTKRQIKPGKGKTEKTPKSVKQSNRIQERSDKGSIPSSHDFSDKENSKDDSVQEDELSDDDDGGSYTEDDVDPMSENDLDVDVEDMDDSSPEKDIKDPAEDHIAYLEEFELDKNNKPRRFKCTICGKCSSAKSDLIKHIRIHTGDRPYKCKICNASFIQVTAFHGHVTIHTGEKPFKCDLCRKSFAIKDRLRLHMRIHTGEKPHKCSQCNLTFARRSQVTQHQRVHSGKKDYQCTECNARFASYHTLKGHVMAHRGVKEFQCGACGKKFIRVEGMYKHIRTVHRGSRPYTCEICGKAFKGHLRQHMRLHLGMRPYQCSTCGSSFTQNSQLTVHMRIHTGERPYKCQICGAAFAHSSACKIHMRSHTGEKPFSCILCSAAFAQLPHLKKHMKCVHNATKPYLCKLCKEYFQTQSELEAHTRDAHGIAKTAEEEAEEIVEEASLARLRNRLAVLLYRISSEERRCKFGFGSLLVDEVLKLSLQSSGHEPFEDPSLSRLDELRKNVLLLLQWTIPKDTMEEYHKNNMTVDEVLDMLTT